MDTQLVRKTSRRPDRLVRLMLSHCIFGAAVGIVWAAILFVSNFDGLRGLILHSDIAGWWIALLFAGFAEFFACIVCATAIMLLPLESDASDSSGFWR